MIIVCFIFLNLRCTFEPEGLFVCTFVFLILLPFMFQLAVVLRCCKFFFFFKLVLKFSKNVILVTIEPPLVQMKNGKTRANRDSDPILHFSHLAGFLVVKIRVLSLERVVHTNLLIKKERWGFHILGLSLVGQFTAV